MFFQVFKRNTYILNKSYKRIPMALQDITFVGWNHFWKKILSLSTTNSCLIPRNHILYFPQRTLILSTRDYPKPQILSLKSQTDYAIQITSLSQRAKTHIGSVIFVKDFRIRWQFCDFRRQNFWKGVRLCNQGSTSPFYFSLLRLFWSVFASVLFFEKVK